MMGSVLLSLVTCVLVSMVQCQTDLQPLCPQSAASSISLSLNSLKNNKGNWVTKVGMERGGSLRKMNTAGTEPWTIDVNANTSSCEGVQSNLHFTLTLTAPVPQLGPDYELFPGIGYYKYHTTPKPWAGARQACAEEGAHLVIINSEKEDDVIKKLIARHPTITGASSNDWSWVGVERKAEKYVTIFGESLESTGFTRWHPGQPNKNANDNCILNHRTSGGLGDVICDWIVGFTCEREF